MSFLPGAGEVTAKKVGVPDMLFAEENKDGSKSLMSSLPQGEEKARNFLKDAGLEYSSMDATSFEVFKSLVESDFDMRGVTNSLKDPASRQDIRCTPTATEELILKQLEYQTSLIRHLQERIDELTHVVMTHGMPVSKSNSCDSDYSAKDRRTDRESPYERYQNQSNRNESLGLPNDEERYHNSADPARTPTDAEVESQEHRSQPREEARDAENNNHNTLISFYTAVYESFEMLFSKVAKTLQLFMVLRRQQVPNLDVALILKTLFIVAILMSRLNRRQGSSHPLKLYLVSAIVILGFLYQLGYIHFLYHFFIKENYPGRIWDGEEIDLEELERNPRPRQPQPAGQQEQQQNDDENDGFDWRQTLFGGRIRPPDLDQDTNLLNVLQDIFLLVGTFFLSIIPMWKPQRLNAHDRDGNVDEQIPLVDPPADPVEAQEVEEEDI